MFNQGNRFLPVHCSKKEVRRLHSAGYSYEEIGIVLGVSRAHAHRAGNGYRCRCGLCPRARSLKKLLALTPAKRTKRPPRPRGRNDGENGGGILETVLGLASLWGAFKSGDLGRLIGETDGHDAPKEPPKISW